MRGRTFYRPARVYPSVLPADDIVISTPPVVQSAQGGALSWLQYMLPALGMLGSMVFIFAFGPSLLILIGGAAFAVCMVGSGVVMGVVQRRTTRKQRKRQRDGYLDYLSRLRKRLLMIAREQRRVDTRLYPPYEELAERVGSRQYLWERRPDDFDFMLTRIGAGPGPLSCRLRLDLSDNDFMVQFVPELRTRAEALVTEYSYLDDLSAAIPLQAFGLVTITGERSRARSLARALLCQLVSFHAPADLRCMVYFPAGYEYDWEWLKWLPHVRRLRQVKAEKRHADESLCMLANSVEDLRTLLQQQIKPELERRHRLIEEAENDQKRQQMAESACFPRLVVLLDGYSPENALGHLPELDALFNENKESASMNGAATFGLTVICLVDDCSQEPAQVQARLSITNVGGLTFEEIRYGGRRREGLLPDAADPWVCERIARSMAPLTLAEADAQRDLSQDIRLLDLLEIPAADALDPARSWRPLARPDLLRVPIGQRADGRLVYLDLKEAADGGMGPHGLLVGATGSGKSELLRTFVTALAITHDPQTLNFVLVDFKGGASFADFDTLPHVAGVVTNLQNDLSLVDRVYSSLLGEQQRRQRLLHDAGNLDNIKQYHAVWQQHPEMEPMPHLVIVVDEFAELIANRPDFLDLFVTMGRVGRSLGLHLLFATQRLEEGRIKGLESHLRYRICLRTYSAPESKIVLGTSDAYYLPATPGMGYFKVDTDTYDLFKTALVSVPYVPLQEQSSLESRIRLFTPSGQLVKYQDSIENEPTLLRGKTELDQTEPGDLFTEMDVIIDRLAQASLPEQNRPVHQVWLPPLEKALSLSSVLEKCQRPDLDGSFHDKSGSYAPFGEMRVPAGLLDMPLQQAQEPLWLDFSGIGGHLALVGAPQSGKSTFLRTLITSFLLTHSPRDVQFYCIDKGGGLLRVFEQAPHVGAVCGKPERDKVRRVVRQMRRIIEEREFLFREHGIDSMATFRALRQSGELTNVPFGDVFLVIDNLAQFLQEFELLESDLIEIAASGLTYGVHLVIAANRWAEIRPRLRDNLGTRLELRLNDINESELGRATASALPPDVPGRGANRDKLYFQVALPLIGNSPSSPAASNNAVQESLHALVQRARASWKGEAAPPVYMLPSMVRWEDLPAPSPEQPPGVSLGLEETGLSPFYIDLISGEAHFMILGDSECGKTSLLRAWMRGIEQRYTPQEVAFAIIDFRKNLLDFVESKHLLAYAYNQPTLTSCIGNLKTDLERRLQKTSDLPLKELRRPQGWSGRHYVLFVDDYENIMTPGAGPLAPLVEYLLAGRDIGFHLALVHRVSGMGRAAFEPVFQRLREMGSAAIIMSGDPSEGKIFYGQAAGALPPGRGYLVHPKRPPTLVQTAFTQPEYASEYA